MPIKNKKWSDINTQRYYDGNGMWIIANLISRASKLPVKEMPLDHLNFSNIGFDAGNSIRKFVSHMKAAMDVDLKYPIILDEDGFVMDGRHRIARAIFEGKETIKFVRFEETHAPDYWEDED